MQKISYSENIKFRDFIHELGFKKPYVICSKTLMNLTPLSHPIYDDLKGLNSHFYIPTETSPTINEVKKINADIKKISPDCVVTFGGGLQIDLAKSLIYFLSSNDDLINLGNKQPISSKALPHVCIPTTAGTGSEVTIFSVIYDDEKKKHSIEHNLLAPDHIYYDWNLLTNLPRGVRANSGIDAFCQSVESLWSVNGTHESRAFAVESITLILQNLTKFYLGENDQEIIKNLQRAAQLSGKSINVSRTTGPHALSYTITALHGVPHGQAVVASLLDFFDFNLSSNETDCLFPGGPQVLHEIFENLALRLNLKSISELRNKFQSLINSVELIDSYKDFKFLSSSDKDKIVNDVNLERLKNNPRIVTKDFLLKVVGP